MDLRNIIHSHKVLDNRLRALTLSAIEINRIAKLSRDLVEVWET